MRTWKRLSAATAISALLGGLSLAAATPAQAAGTTLKLDRVHCVEETDEVGSDSPYVLVFATSPSNSGAVRFGKWGPGGWDTAVDTGDIYYPNGTIASGVQPGWDAVDRPDGGGRRQRHLLRRHGLHRLDDVEPVAGLVLAAGRAAADQHDAHLPQRRWDCGTGNDDGRHPLFPISGSSAGSTVQFTGDGGNYWLRFKLV